LSGIQKAINAGDAAVLSLIGEEMGYAVKLYKDEFGNEIGAVKSSDLEALLGKNRQMSTKMYSGSPEMPDGLAPRDARATRPDIGRVDRGDGWRRQWA
jgi:hypothetical protein